MTREEYEELLSRIGDLELRVANLESGQDTELTETLDKIERALDESAAAQQKKQPHFPGQPSDLQPDGGRVLPPRPARGSFSSRERRSGAAGA